MRCLTQFIICNVCCRIDIARDIFRQTRMNRTMNIPPIWLPCHFWHCGTMSEVIVASNWIIVPVPTGSTTNTNIQSKISTLKPTLIIELRWHSKISQTFIIKLMIKWKATAQHAVSLIFGFERSPKLFCFKLSNDSSTTNLIVF